MKVLNIFFWIFLFLVQVKAFAYNYAIVVDKETHVLNVYQWNESGERELISSYAAITGKEKGNKTTRGDLKTPEGIYFVTHSKTRKQMRRQYGVVAKKYGPLAFVLNYPNIYDQEKRKTGSGIWIHGIDSDKRILNPFDTEGCVALSNNDILDLKQYIFPYQTPVVIVKSAKSLDLNKIFSDGDQEYQKWIEDWKNSWENWDPVEYGKHYSAQFKSTQKNKAKWLAHKQKLAIITHKNVNIEIKNPKIVEFKDQLVLTFEQKYSSSLTKDEGKKSLYLQKENDSFAILAEEFHPLFNWK